jgi:hypothetical protein
MADLELIQTLDGDLGTVAEMVVIPDIDFNDFCHRVNGVSVRFANLRGHDQVTPEFVMEGQRVDRVVATVRGLYPTEIVANIYPRDSVEDARRDIRRVAQVFIDALREGDQGNGDVEDALLDLENALEGPDNGDHGDSDQEAAHDVEARFLFQEREANRVRGALSYQRLIRYLRTNNPRLLRDFRRSLREEAAAGNFFNADVDIDTLDNFTWW